MITNNGKKNFILVCSLAIISLVVSLLLFYFLEYSLELLQLTIVLFLIPIVIIYPKIGLVIITIFIPFEDMIVKQLAIIPSSGQYFDEFILGLLLINLLFTIPLTKNKVSLNYNGVGIISILVVLYFIVAGISAYFNETSLIVYAFSIRALFQYLILFYIIIYHPMFDNRFLRKILVITFFIAIAQIPISFYFMATKSVLPYFADRIVGPGVIGQHNLAYGSFYYPNALATFLLFIIILLINFFQFEKKKIFIIIALFLLILLILTFSRSSIIIIVLILFFLLMMTKSKKILATLLITFICFMVLFYFSPKGTGYSGSRYQFELSADKGRFGILKDALPIFKNHYLIGVGPGMFGSGTANYFDSYYNQKLDIGTDANPTTADSSLVSMAVEVGVAGLTVFCSVIFSIIFIAWKKFKSSIDKNRYYYLALVLITIVFLWEGIFATAWENHQVSFYFWLLAAYLLTEKKTNKIKKSYET